MAKHQTINHIAFIMDGNGRWAKSRNLTRVNGHYEGAKRISEIILECKNQGIKEASFFAFSTENWNRPKSEVSFLLKLLNSYLNKKNFKWFKENNVRINLIGFKDVNTKKIYDKINDFCLQTNEFDSININICFNYGSQDEIISAVNKIISSKNTTNISKEEFNEFLMIKTPVDLLVRTSGEKRISNFLLWQISYSEIIFEETFWPDYTPEILIKNIQEYKNRDRRFGGVEDE